MDTQIVTIDTANYDIVAAAMGIQETQSIRQSSNEILCRLRIWNRPVMGTIEKSGKKRPKTACVFHISQTEALQPSKATGSGVYEMVKETDSYTLEREI